MLHRSTEHTPGVPLPLEVGFIDPHLVVRAPQSGMGLLLAHGTPVIPQDTPRRRAALALKRGFDMGFAAVALLALAPVFGALALLLLVTQGGPVFVGRPRLGQGGRPFLLHEFRTGGSGGLARFLRDTGLDTLPHLVNVLLGEMSFVGPQPHPPAMAAAGVPYDALVPYYRMRLGVRPGITGWAQVNGHFGPTRDAGSARARVDHDLAYVQNFSLLLDLRIMALTLRGRP